MTPEELTSFFFSKRWTQKQKSFISPSGNTKCKLGKNSLQKFKKSDSVGWVKVQSVYYKYITMNQETGLLRIEKVM